MSGKTNKENNSLSRNLRELRSIAVTITGNKKMKVKFDKKAETSYIELDESQIVLTLNALPKWVTEREVLAKKCLDGIFLHECCHDIISKPVWDRYNNWVTKIKRERGFFNLAHAIVQILEDGRVDHFGKLRYRHDFGKRLLLERLIIKDSVETSFKTGKADLTAQYGEAPLIYSILVNEGKYGADCSQVYKMLSKEGKEASEKCLSLFHNFKYKRLSLDLVRSCQQVYDLIAPFIKGKEFESYIRHFIPQRLHGKIKPEELSEELKEALEKAIEEEVKELDEKKKKELLDDLLKGAGAGAGTGEELPSPTPNFAEYQRLVEKNKPEINRLLNKLKQTVKPLTKRQRFQKRGKFMTGLLSKAFVNSFRSVVKNIYVNVHTEFEKEQVAIQFLFDFSGSVNRTEALDITTILTEVFANYVDDMGFGVAVFGADSQKIKTFFEQSNNTKARVGNITVSPSGTEIGVLLESSLKMFNNIRDRRKILVVASDFSFGDDNKARELIRLYPKADVELIFIGFCNCQQVDTWAREELPKNYARRSKIVSVMELPEAFLSVYLNIQK